mmetsp:Transcript_81216/g.238621  ORF Transcript_81216/g.238621 Transcript_81216/m.238621 type:complete len:222 (-) Transcript_81216:358-1023(-)
MPHLVLSRISTSLPAWPAMAMIQGPTRLASWPPACVEFSSSATSKSLIPPTPRSLIETTSPPALGMRMKCMLPFDVPLMNGPTMPAQATAVTPRDCEASLLGSDCSSSAPSKLSARRRFSSCSTSCMSTERSRKESVASWVTVFVNGIPSLLLSHHKVLPPSILTQRYSAGEVVSTLPPTTGCNSSWCVMGKFPLPSSFLSSPSASLFTMPLQRWPSIANS